MIDGHPFRPDGDLAVHPVRVSEEARPDRPEVGDRPVGGAVLDEPSAECLERFLVGNIEGEVVEMPAAEDLRLAGTVPALSHLEGVQRRVLPDVEEDVPCARLGEVDPHGRAEDRRVEPDEPLHVLGEKRHVMESGEHHEGIFERAATANKRCESGSMSSDDTTEVSSGSTQDEEGPDQQIH